tara:strand:- start:476 stop:886 length:411 start_codon:yes stop_codon:yes gene_type:complete
MPIQILKGHLVHEESYSIFDPLGKYWQLLYKEPKNYLNYVDHGVSPEISYDCSTGQITINSDDTSVDLSVIGYTPPEEPNKEYIYGRCLEAVTDYKTMTIISKNKEGNRAKSGSKTYTYNKHNWDNWKQATQQEQS